MKHVSLRFAAAVALAAGLALAQTPSPTPQQTAPGRHGQLRMRLGRVLRALNLTDNQRQQAKAILQQAHQTAQPVRQQLQQNRQLLREAVKTGKTDVEIQQLSAQQGDLLGQALAIRTEAWAKVYALLTPEQRAQADQLR